jgi:hypothetical protein
MFGLFCFSVDPMFYGQMLMLMQMERKDKGESQMKNGKQQM